MTIETIYCPGTPEITQTENSFTIGEREIPKFQRRQLEIKERQIVSDERKIILSVSSEDPAKYYYFDEVLSHEPEAVDLTRFNNSAPVLFNHKRDNYLGVILRGWLENKKLYTESLFDDHEFALQIINSINNKVIRNVSIGFFIDAIQLLKTENDRNTYIATQWTPIEFSFVTLAEDITVGVNRNLYLPDYQEQKSIIIDLKGGDNGKINKDINQEPNPNQNQPKIEPQPVTKTMTITEINEPDVAGIERQRIKSILALQAKYGHPELAERAINENFTVEQTRSKYLDLITEDEPQNPIAKTLKPVDMDKKDQRRYSFLRAVGLACGHFKKEECGLELEVSREIAKRLGRNPKKLFVDAAQLVAYRGSDDYMVRGRLDNYGKRAPLQTLVPASAGDLVGTDLLAERFIEQLYVNSAVLDQVTTIPDLTANIEIPREQTYTGGYWIGETQTITEDTPTFDKIALNPHKLAVLTKITYEMLEQSSIGLEMLLRMRLLRGLTLTLDKTILFGTGLGNEPLGIISHPEVNSIDLGANGGALDWENVVRLQTIPADFNVRGASNSYIFNTRTKGKLMTTLDHITGGGNWIYQMNAGNPTVAGYSARVSNQIPNDLVKGTATDLTAIIYGDFSQVLLAFWSAMEIMANPYSEFDEAIIKIRAMQLADINLNRGDYFAVATDVQNN